MLNEQSFREEIRNLKTLIREDPAVRAQYDVDGDGVISAEEWDRAVTLLRRELENRPPKLDEAVRDELEPACAGRPSLVTCPEVVVKQRVEHREVFLGYETCNRYTFLDPVSGTDIGGAEEESGGVGGFMARQFLGPARPLNLSVTDAHNGVWLEGRRPFRLLGSIRPPALTVNWNQGLLGTVQRVWPLLIRRRYRICVANNPGLNLMIDGTLLHPWTFPVKRGDRQVASILKKWSGTARELFTDADTFLVRFEDPNLSDEERRLLIAAALAVDFDFFEKKPNG